MKELNKNAWLRKSSCMRDIILESKLLQFVVVRSCYICCDAHKLLKHCVCYLFDKRKALFWIS